MYKSIVVNKIKNCENFGPAQETKSELCVDQTGTNFLQFTLIHI